MKKFKGVFDGTLDGEEVEIAIEGEVSSIDPKPDPDDDVIFDLKSNLIGDAFRDHVKPGPYFQDWNGRPRSTNNTTQNGIDCAKGGLGNGSGRIVFPLNWMAPVYLNRVIRTYLRPEEPNGHCQIRLSSPLLKQGVWTYPHQIYRWEANLIMPEGRSWDKLSWILPMQGHPGAYGPDWDAPQTRPPAIALYMKRDHWQLWVRGSDQIKPTQYTHNTSSVDVPFVPGIQKLIIVFRADPLSNSSFVTCTINGNELETIRHPVGLNHSALGPNNPSLNLAMGYYGTQPRDIPDPLQYGVVDIVSSRLVRVKQPIGKLPVDPPQLKVVNNSFDVPILQGDKSKGDVRGWFYPSVVYANSVFHVFGTVDRSDGRHLYYTIDFDKSNRVLLRYDVEQVTVWKDSNGFKMSGIQKNSNGTFSRFTGVATDPTTWIFDVAPREELGYPTGDIHTVNSNGKVWIKGHDWPRGSDGKPVDYFRRWFFKGQEIPTLLPTVQPTDGLRYDIYSLSVFEPLIYGWKSNWQYVALVGLFKITDSSPTPNQHGPIDLVWCVSHDGITWEFPWNDRHAVDKGSKTIMVNPGFNPMAFGNELRVYCGVAHFSHNNFNKNRDAITGTALATITKEKFESSFGF